ncbi:MAG: hypothetical protein ABF672_10900 [Gluconobacter oxydans]|uniref:hypothetical protein n=1 Tax=Gluconobacter oxydans TaxID=442 RepID=UPI0039EB1105
MTSENADYSQSIANYGAAAVKKYRDISGIRNDNEIPEIFLGGQIAIGLHEEFRLQCHVERYYERILEDLCFTIDSDLKKAFGSKRADVALYRDGKPFAIIELKICDERDRNGRNLLDDLEKMRELALKTGIEIYLGTLMTDVRKVECAKRRATIEKKLEGCFSAHSSLEPAGYGAGWKWQFLAGQFWGKRQRAIERVRPHIPL